MKQFDHQNSAKGRSHVLNYGTTDEIWAQLSWEGHCGSESFQRKGTNNSHEMTIWEFRRPHAGRIWNQHRWIFLVISKISNLVIHMSLIFPWINNTKIKIVFTLLPSCKGQLLTRLKPLTEFFILCSFSCKFLKKFSSPTIKRVHFQYFQRKTVRPILAS